MANLSRAIVYPARHEAKGRRRPARASDDDTGGRLPEDGCCDFAPARAQGDRRKRHLATLGRPLLSPARRVRDTPATLRASPPNGAPLEKGGYVSMAHSDLRQRDWANI